LQLPNATKQIYTCLSLLVIEFSWNHGVIQLGQDKFRQNLELLWKCWRQS